MSSTGMKNSSCSEVPKTGLLACVGKPYLHPSRCISRRGRGCDNQLKTSLFWADNLTHAAKQIASIFTEISRLSSALMLMLSRAGVQLIRITAIRFSLTHDEFNYFVFMFLLAMVMFILWGFSAWGRTMVLISDRSLPSCVFGLDSKFQEFLWSPG